MADITPAQTRALIDLCSGPCRVTMEVPKDREINHETARALVRKRLAVEGQDEAGYMVLSITKVGRFEVEGPL